MPFLRHWCEVRILPLATKKYIISNTEDIMQVLHRVKPQGVRDCCGKEKTEEKAAKFATKLN